MQRIQRLNAKYAFRGFGRALDLRRAIHGRYAFGGSWNRSDHAATATYWNAVFHDLTDAYERVKRSHTN
ncbi:MAG: hypothetical protein KY467_17550, partial [Gemmatimonadetes bacterium]|nr:hypothetical protein [Gemmatimonadota bacterium]